MFIVIEDMGYDGGGGNLALFTKESDAISFLDLYPQIDRWYYSIEEILVDQDLDLIHAGKKRYMVIEDPDSEKLIVTHLDLKWGEDGKPLG